MLPSAPLFEDDGTEEMERLDGLRVLVNQLGLLDLLLPAGQLQSLTALRCLCCIAGHSAPLARQGRSGLFAVPTYLNAFFFVVAVWPGLLNAICPQHIALTSEGTLPALRLLRLLVAADRQVGALLEMQGFAGLVFRHFVSADSALRFEAAALLKTLVFFGFQIGPFVDLLPSVIVRLQTASMEADLMYSIAETAVMWVAESDEGLLQQLCALVRVPLAPSPAMLHFVAALLSLGNKSLSQDLMREVVVPQLATFSSESSFLFPLLRCFVSQPAALFPLLPPLFWAQDPRAWFSPPRPRTDATNRFRAQKRIALLARERPGILCARQFLLACAAVLVDLEAALPPNLNIAELYGCGVDLVGCLALTGVDESLCESFLSHFVLEPRVLLAASNALSPPSSAAGREDACKQVMLICASVHSGLREAFFPPTDEAWLSRCRQVACDFFLAPDKSVSSIFASRFVAHIRFALILHSHLPIPTGTIRMAAPFWVLNGCWPCSRRPACLSCALRCSCASYVSCRAPAAPSRRCQRTSSCRGCFSCSNPAAMPFRTPPLAALHWRCSIAFRLGWKALSLGPTPMIPP